MNKSFLLLFFILFSTTLWAKIVNITGTIFLSQLNNRANCKVKFTNLKTFVSDSTLSAVNGSYSISLDSGTYRIGYTASNYRPINILSSWLKKDSLLNPVFLTKTVTIIGLVYDTEYITIPNCTVKFTNLNTLFSDSIRSNNNGRFSITIDSGFYKIDYKAINFINNSFTRSTNSFVSYDRMLSANIKFGQIFQINKINHKGIKIVFEKDTLYFRFLGFCTY